MKRKEMLDYFDSAVGHLFDHRENVGHLAVEWPRLVGEVLHSTESISPVRLEGFLVRFRMLYWELCAGYGVRPHDADAASWESAMNAIRNVEHLG